MSREIYYYKKFKFFLKKPLTNKSFCNIIAKAH